MKENKKRNDKIESEKEKAPVNFGTDTEKAKKTIPETLSLQWQAPEFDYNPKDISWFWMTLIFAIIFIGAALWQKNFLFAIFIIIAWFALVNVANRFPPIWEFIMDNKGLTIKRPNRSKGNEKLKFYPWETFRGFDIHEATEEYEELVFKSRSRLSPYLKINIYTAQEEKIKNFLLQFLPEEEYEKSLAETLGDVAGF